MSHTRSGEEATPLQSAIESLTYWTQRALLTLFGPAQLDDAHDPVALLRRGHREHHPNMHWIG